MEGRITTPHLDFIRFKRWCFNQDKKQSDPKSLHEYFTQQPHDVELDATLTLAERIGHEVEYGGLKTDAYQLSVQTSEVKLAYYKGWNFALDAVIDFIKDVLNEEFGVPVKKPVDGIQPEKLPTYAFESAYPKYMKGLTDEEFKAKVEARLQQIERFTDSGKIHFMPFAEFKQETNVPEPEKPLRFEMPPSYDHTNDIRDAYQYGFRAMINAPLILYPKSKIHYVDTDGMVVTPGGNKHVTTRFRD